MNTAKTAGFLVAGLALVGLGIALGRGLRPDVPEPPVPGVIAPPPPDVATLPLSDPRGSLVFYPFLNQTGITDDAVAAAELVLRGLRDDDPAALEEALASYQLLNEQENFGGEYPTLEWFCEYALADESQRRTMLENDDGRRFVELFGREDWALLAEYLTGKYNLGRMDRKWLFYLDEIVRFNSPYRHRWERTDRILDLLSIEPGMEVVDVGAGGGFYSFRFAELVGRDGRAYAVEMNEQHLEYLRRVASDEELDSLVVVPTDGSFPDLPEGSVDRVFLCATYQTLYLSIREDERTRWLEDVKRALAPDGLLVVAENEPLLEPGLVPFGGISVSLPLLEAQLVAYGFERVTAEYVVPQRYVLVLRKAGGAEG